MTRLETGIFKPKNDWPGVFIRGDNALFMAARLRAADDLLKRAGHAPLLDDIASLLESCDVEQDHAR